MIFFYISTYMYNISTYVHYIPTLLCIFYYFLTLKCNIILIKNSQCMIFLHTFYNLLSLHQQNFNHTSFETILSRYEMKINLCCKIRSHS